MSVTAIATVTAPVRIAIAVSAARTTRASVASSGAHPAATAPVRIARATARTAMIAHVTGREVGRGQASGTIPRCAPAGRDVVVDLIVLGHGEAPAHVRWEVGKRWRRCGGGCRDRPG